MIDIDIIRKKRSTSNNGNKSNGVSTSVGNDTLHALNADEASHAKNADNATHADSARTIDSTSSVWNTIKNWIANAGEGLKNVFLRKDVDDSTAYKLTVGQVAVKKDASSTTSTADGTLNVEGKATIGGDASVEGALTVAKNATIGGVNINDGVDGANGVNGVNGVWNNLFDTSNKDFGKGFGLRQETDGSHLWLDYLYVRTKAYFEELEVRVLSRVAGDYLFTSAGSKIVYVEALTDRYRCYYAQDDGTTQTINNWEAGDFARCKTSNIKEGISKHASNRYYTRLVIGVSSEPVTVAALDGTKKYGYIDLAMNDSNDLTVSWQTDKYACTDSVDGTDIPQRDDAIVQIGNVFAGTVGDKAKRGNALLLSASNGGIYIYNGINVPEDADMSRFLSHQIDTNAVKHRSDKFQLMPWAQPSANGTLFCLRGDYSASATYGSGDVVMYGGQLWCCVSKTAINGQEPSAGSKYWTLYVAKGEKGYTGNYTVRLYNLGISNEWDKSGLHELVFDDDVDMQDETYDDYGWGTSAPTPTTDKPYVWEASYPAMNGSFDKLSKKDKVSYVCITGSKGVNGKNGSASRVRYAISKHASTSSYTTCPDDITDAVQQFVDSSANTVTYSSWGDWSLGMPTTTEQKPYLWQVSYILVDSSNELLVSANGREALYYSRVDGKDGAAGKDGNYTKYWYNESPNYSWDDDTIKEFAFKSDGVTPDDSTNKANGWSEEAYNDSDSSQYYTWQASYLAVAGTNNKVSSDAKVSYVCLTGMEGQPGTDGYSYALVRMANSYATVKVTGSGNSATYKLHYRLVYKVTRKVGSGSVVTIAITSAKATIEGSSVDLKTLYYNSTSKQIDTAKDIEGGTQYTSTDRPADYIPVTVVADGQTLYDNVPITMEAGVAIDINQELGEINTNITNAQGDINTIRNTANSNSATISNHDGRLSTVEQTANNISLKVSSLQSMAKSRNLISGGNVTGLYNKQYEVFRSTAFKMEQGKTYTVTARLWMESNSNGHHVMVQVFGADNSWSPFYHSDELTNTSGSVVRFCFEAGTTKQMVVGIYERNSSGADPGSGNYNGVHVDWVRVDEGDWTGLDAKGETDPNGRTLDAWTPSEEETDALNLLPDPDFSEAIGYSDYMGERNSWNWSYQKMGSAVDWMSKDGTRDGDGACGVLFNRNGANSDTADGLRYIVPFRGPGTYSISCFIKDMHQTDTSRPAWDSGKVFGFECHPMDAGKTRITGGFAIYRNKESQRFGDEQCFYSYTFGNTAIRSGTTTEVKIAYLEVLIFLQRNGCVRVSRLCLSKSDHYIYWNANEVSEARKKDVKQLATGIDIFNRKMVFTADNSVFQTNSGKQIAAFTENGVNAELMHVDTLTTRNSDGSGIVIQSAMMDVYGNNHIPNIRFGVNANGYAVLKYYDNHGNFLYDLGPSGLSASNMQSAIDSTVKAVTCDSVVERANSDAYFHTIQLNGYEVYQSESSLSDYEEEWTIFGYPDVDSNSESNYPKNYYPAKSSGATQVTLHNYFAAKLNNAYVSDTSNSRGLSTASLAEAANGKWFTGTPFAQNGALCNLANETYFTVTYGTYTVPDDITGGTSHPYKALVAEEIKGVTGGDTFEIVAEKSYDMPYNQLIQVAQEEEDNKELPAFKGEVKDIDQYDTVFIGGPIWWGTYPRVMFTFFKTYDLNGKTIIPFTTHEGSGLGNVVSNVKAAYPKATVTGAFSIAGHNVRSGKKTIDKWLEGLGY